VTTLVFVGVVAVVTLLALFLPVVNPTTALLALIVARQLVDLGTSTGHGVFPTTLLNAAIALALLVLVVFSGGRTFPYRLIPLVLLALSWVLLGVVVGLARFGTTSGAVEERLRLLSGVAVFVTAARLASARPIRPLLLVAVLPAALLLLLGYAVGSPLMVQSGNRAAGTFSHANAAAAFMCVAAMTCLSLWFFQRSRSMLLVGLTCTLALIVTQSIGGLAGFVAGAFTVLIINVRIALGPRLAAVLATAVTIFVVTVFSRLGARLAEFTSPYAGLAPGEEDSLAWRFTNWSLLLHDWKDSPWFGYGLGSTSTQLQPLGVPPHSIFVQLLVETGVVGVAVVALAWLVLAVRLVRLAVRGRWEASILLGLLSLVLVNGSESNLIGYTATIYLLLFIMGVLAARCVGPADELALRPSRSRQPQVSRLSPGPRRASESPDIPAAPQVLSRR
jgi:O-antigen ligase